MMNILNTSCYSLIATVLTVGMALAQGPGGGRRPHMGPPPGQGAGFGGGDNEVQAPVSPIVDALDQDQDGSISEQELSESAQSLIQLDANNDGKLSEDEMKPAPPQGAQWGYEARKGRGRESNAPPLIVALDLDQDGEISDVEIENAPILLQVLDHNEDGKLSRMEIRPNRRFNLNQD